MIWARDAAPDTFRIRIWSEDAGGNDLVVYDNGTEQAIAVGAPTPRDPPEPAMSTASGGVPV